MFLVSGPGYVDKDVFPVRFPEKDDLCSHEVSHTQPKISKHSLAVLQLAQLGRHVGLMSKHADKIRSIFNVTGSVSILHRDF